MIIAEQLRNSNRAEYLLYMWQVEDLIRAYDCNIERIEKEYLSRFQLDDEKTKVIRQWYADLCEMIQHEGLTQQGHLQINCNILQELTELHEQLLHSDHFPYYKEMYHNVLPHIVRLRAKGSDKSAPELQTCFEALYGALLLKLQHKPVSSETTLALKDITTLLGQLSDYYFQDKKEPISF